jgi:hypothetical protein
MPRMVYLGYNNTMVANSSYGLISLLSTPVVLPGVNLPIPLVVWLVIVIMVGLSVWQWVWLFRTAYPIHQQLQATLSLIKQDLNTPNPSPQQLAKITQAIEQYPAVSSAWQAYQQTMLALPNPLQPTTKTLWATQAPEATLNQHSLLDNQGFPLVWFQTFPGVLTSVGLLGTFLALLCGLSFLSVQANGQVLGIEDLINSLSGKFASSVVGLVLSLGFLGAEKIWVGRINHSIVAMQHKLASAFPRLTPEQMLAKIATDMEAQSVGFRQFFSTELADTLSASFQDSMSPQMDRMVTAIEGLQVATQALSQEKSESLSQTLTPLFNQFHTTMADMAQSFKQSLTQGASQEIGQLTQSLGQAARFLQGMEGQTQTQQTGFQDMLDQLQHTMLAMAQQHSTHAQQLQGSVESLMDNTLQQVAQQATLSQQAQALQQVQLAEQSHSISNSLSSLTDLLSQHRTSFERLYLAAQTLENGLPAVREATASSQVALQSHTDSLPQLVQLVTDLTQSVTQTDSLLKQQRSLYEDVDDKLSRMLGQLHDAFDQYHTTMGTHYREQHDQFTNHLSSATSALGQTVLELQERLDDLSELLDRLPAINKVSV